MQRNTARALSTMRAIVAEGGRAIVSNVPRPSPLPGFVPMRVLAAGLNRADLLQVAGRYPPPPGVPETLGLEAAGVLPDGSIAGALVAGGALAEEVLVPEGNVIRLPSLSSTDLAAIPEAFVVAHHLLFQLGGFGSGQTVVVLAAGSGVGTALIQLAATVRDGNVIAVARGASKREFAKTLGATLAVDPSESPTAVSDAVMRATNGVGADVLLDCVGASAFRENARALRNDATWVLYGLLGGAKSNDINLAALLSKRIRLLSTTMRSRSAEFKAECVREFCENYARKFEDGTLKPVVDSVFDGLESVEGAMEYMRSNKNVGKIIVRVASE